MFRRYLKACDRDCYWNLFWFLGHDCFIFDRDNTALSRIPKKRNGCSLRQRNGDPMAFGIEADYLLSLRFLLVWHLVPLALAFAFWTYWQSSVSPEDLQNASVPTLTMLAVFGVAWAMFGSRARIVW